MTIVAGAACPEGVVLAGDSRSSIQLTETAVRTSTDYAHKVFEVDGRFLAATFGWATLHGKTISGHVREFGQEGSISGDVHQAATQLRDYFQSRVQSHIEAGLDPAPDAGVEPLGFIIGGYDDSGVGHVKQVWPLGGEVQDICRTTDPGGIWNGEIDVMIRLIKGWDSLRIDTADWQQSQLEVLAQAEYLSNFNWFALQDAIDWTLYVARTTIDTQRFTNGTLGTPGAIPTCGGEVEVATITPGDGVRWVRRTDLRA